MLANVFWVYWCTPKILYVCGIFILGVIVYCVIAAMVDYKREPKSPLTKDMLRAFRDNDKVIEQWLRGK